MSLNPSLTKIKEVSLVLLNIIDDLVQPELKHPLAKKVWNWFAMSRGKQIIMQKSDAELKQKMHQSYLLMEQVFKEVEIAEEIKQSRIHNDGKMQEFVEKRIGKDILELIPDV